MFLRPFRTRDSPTPSPSRISKPRLLRPKPSRLRSVTDAQGRTSTTTPRTATNPSIVEPAKSSPVVTITVGPEKRLFAAHEHILCKSPYFASILRGLPSSPSSPIGPHTNKRISLPDESPEVFSAILEFLYTEEYYPRLQRSTTGDWELEDSSPPTTIPNPYGHVTLPTPPNSPPQKPTRPPGHLQSVCPLITLPNQPPLLRETVLYCAATTYLLPSLSRLCLRKQGLQSGIDVATILRSAQYAYANTPDSDSRLRAHYLALIIRCRGTFKRSGTLQREMERGGSKLFFDLFVALCNHVDDVIEATGAGETEARMI